MIFYPTFGSYTPMFSIPDKIDEFRVICFIFATFAKSFSVVYRCFTFSVYGSFSQRRKHNKVSTFCHFQQVWHEMKGIFLPILPLCSPRRYLDTLSWVISLRKSIFENISNFKSRSCKLRAVVTCEIFIATFSNISC